MIEKPAMSSLRLAVLVALASPLAAIAVKLLFSWPSDVSNLEVALPIKTKRQERKFATIKTVLVVLSAGNTDAMHIRNFVHLLESLEKLTIVPDSLVLYTDWNAHPVYSDMLESTAFKLSFPFSVVPRPRDTMGLYPTHYYNGHLKMFFWWAMNTAFVSTGAEQVCYMEDDIALHPDFFAWVNETRAKLPQNEYWSLHGEGAAVYVPMCVDRFEWSLLLYYYQDFCLKEQGAWDLILYGLLQNGVLPPVRAQTTARAAFHRPSAHEDPKQTLQEFTSNELPLNQFKLQTPYYPGEKETGRFADLNFENFTQSFNHALSQTQLLKMIDFCTSVALDTRAKMDVEEKLIPLYEYNVSHGMDILSHDLASVHDNDHSLNKSKNICNSNADCMGFVHLPGTSYFKSSGSLEYTQKANNKRMTLYVKKCERITYSNVCVPKFEYLW